ncbi:MAG: vWA domain-containing protein [Nocardioidaceae bacterium]
MQISAHLDLDIVAVEVDETVAVMLDLAAPVVEAAHERAAATLQVVLDRSGSMDGVRLHGAVDALCGLVARLDARDNFGVVVFDHMAEVVVPAGPLTDKPGTIAALRAVAARGATDLAAGYLRGLQELKRAAGGLGGTVLLISDGHANQGLTDPEQLAGLARSAAGERIVTATLGYGLGYDETLLVGLARGGSGNHHFAADPDAASTLIAGEAAELLAKSVQAASCILHLEPSVTMLRLFNDLPVTEIGPGRLMVELGDLYSGEQRRLVLELGVPGMAARGLATVATMSLSYVDVPALSQHMVSVPVQVNVVPGDEAARRVADPVVRTEVLFQEAQQAKREASEALERGDRASAILAFQHADDLLADALGSAPSEVVAELDRERRDIMEMRERSAWDDATLMSKVSRASYHSSNRKRGRRQP